MESIFGYELNKTFDYENGFYVTSDPRRMQKLIAHYELYKKITNLPGAIVECGVFKGTSLIRFAQFRDMLESAYSRKIIGFDAFGKFPISNDGMHDQVFIEKFEREAGDGMSVAELQAVFDHKGISNVELVAGNISETVPEYQKLHPELKISILHIDVDVYLPSKVALEYLYEHVVPGGICIFDDYGTVYGETKAVDEFFAGKSIKLLKLPCSHIPTYLVKE
ncbi:MAG: TylF/MycF/NovP-related O-methyltransferase [Methylococcaceae bacterium]|nr:TylF/MycF/NovP-related O-methyltransferase [Methylococcaceae bacterium]MDP3904203.1 TylF/MycF/NovP-related O-methyltransferase [Methylococcaceae bacterium]